MADEQLRVGITGDASGLEKASQSAVTSLNKIDKSAVQTAGALSQLPKVSQQVSVAASNMAKSAATAGGAIEKTKTNFTGITRVLQDLPFGFIAISNNLEQLIPAAGGAGLAFSALISLLSFAQVGLSNWTRGLGGSKEALDEQVKAAHEARQALDTYVESLNDINKARVTGLQNAQDELVSLKTLYTATQNVNIPLSERKKLVDELQEQYPKYFANIKDETILAGGAEEAYKRLSVAILASARARAAQDVLVDIQKQLLAVEQQYAGAVIETAKAQVKRNEQEKRGFTRRQSEFNTGMAAQAETLQNAQSIADAESTYTGAVKKVNDLLKQRNDLQTRAKQLTDTINKTVQANPEALLKPTGNIKAAKEEKSAFLFDFLPFDPTGKLKPEQRAELVKAIDSFQKEVGGMIQGVPFKGNQEEVIKQAFRIDADIKSGNIKFNLDFVRKQLIDGFDKLKDSDILPPDTLTGISEEVVKQFERGLSDGMERHKNDFGNIIQLDDPQSLLANFKLQLSRIGGEIPKIIEATDIFGNKITLPFDKLFDTGQVNVQGIRDALKNAFNDISKDVQSLSDNLSKTLQSIGSQMFVSFGEALGAALAGGDLKSVFESLFSFIGGALQDLGKQMITLSPVIAALKVAIKSLNPAILLPAGIALVAIGGVLRSIHPKGFAEGGLVSGPTLGLVGEGVGTSRSNPEVIAPLDKLKGMINQTQSVVILNSEVRLRNKDLIFAVRQGEKSQRRAT